MGSVESKRPSKTDPKVQQNIFVRSFDRVVGGLWDVGNLVKRTQHFNVLQHAWFPVAGIFCAYSNARNSSGRICPNELYILHHLAKKEKLSTLLKSMSRIVRDFVTSFFFGKCGQTACNAFCTTRVGGNMQR